MNKICAGLRVGSPTTPVTHKRILSRSSGSCAATFSQECFKRINAGTPNSGTGSKGVQEQKALKVIVRKHLTAMTMQQAPQRTTPTGVGHVAAHQLTAPYLESFKWRLRRLKNTLLPRKCEDNAWCPSTNHSLFQCKVMHRIKPAPSSSYNMGVRVATLYEAQH